MSNLEKKGGGLSSWIWSYIVSVGLIVGGLIAFIATWCIKGFFTAVLCVIIGFGGLFGLLLILCIVCIFAEWLHDNIFIDD